MVKISLKKIYATYSWKWDLEDEMCGICQQSFEQMCSECTHPVNCKPCIGSCKHAYHMHCVSKWLQSNKICPMCRKDWSYYKIFD
ncbi:RING-H2 zinc finger domain-containing protein [Hamiltosporidium tvaerminnensis]|uniref:RING-H2 zinc finger domain-containing protein n=1 Tax=Hamiltosporidium tvaerminnensis TaxID=1176355 RepID=A0A4Q9KR18_9MICR|nr:RING-H2 zinc finger domain-containing protein [Hamiltosporidium tvaerminnensis]